MANPRIAIFARSANGNTAPVRVIEGGHTRLARTSHAIAFDDRNDEIVVPNGNRVLIYSRKANGDTAPLRVIQGPDTMLRGASATAVDPVHNLLVVGLEGNSSRTGGLLVFDRTASGNTPPRGVIRGTKSGIIRINQIALYPAKKFIVATQPGDAAEMEPEGAFVGIWSLDDSGDIPPRWKISANARSLLKKPRGITLDPKNKELIVADMRLNSILTYYFPEMF